MASVKKYPFYTEMELKIALQALKERYFRYFVIADIILHTGAELSEVLEITCKQMREGQTFVVDDNPNRAASLKEYKDYARKTLRRNVEKADDDPFFQDKFGSRVNESSIRASISRFSSSTGIDVSLIRFQKTFFLDYMIKNHSRWALKEVASSGRVNEFCNEEWIKDYLGLSDEMFKDIHEGKMEPIIDQGTKYTAESLKDACNRLEKILKEVKKEADNSHPLAVEGQEIIIEDAIHRLQQATGPNGRIRRRGRME